MPLEADQGSRRSIKIRLQGKTTAVAQAKKNAPVYKYPEDEDADTEREVGDIGVGTDMNQEWRGDIVGGSTILVLLGIDIDRHKGREGYGSNERIFVTDTGCETIILNTLLPSTSTIADIEASTEMSDSSGDVYVTKRVEEAAKTNSKTYRQSQNSLSIASQTKIQKPFCSIGSQTPFSPRSRIPPFQPPRARCKSSLDNRHFMDPGQISGVDRLVSGDGRKI
ncbi:hypothetical protein ARMGADRAFT_1035829 [Armillaria gallica]|uniref:Uncharacterized protein n=1 Tax=Armillaria gallica TaxID=47427 RepID=A0A2H3CSR2_ARMGA|nr:hypothetical protein ARMGADRAFT_1035829 [Armillaria gallica]